MVSYRYKTFLSATYFQIKMERTKFSTVKDFFKIQTSCGFPSSPLLFFTFPASPIITELQA
jgi:hypothetical protein